MIASHTPRLFAIRAGSRIIVAALAWIGVAASGAIAGDLGHGDHEHGEHAVDPAQKAESYLRTMGGETCQIPEAELLTADGDPVRLYADLVESRTVLLSFVYTECTTICAPIAANLAQVQEGLADRLGRDIRLISVSIDPVTDTPPRLKAWSGYFEPRPGWSFLTGEKAKVDQLLKRLKVFAPNLEDHPPVMVVANDRSGDCVYANGLATPEQIEAIVLDLADRAPKS